MAKAPKKRLEQLMAEHQPYMGLSNKNYVHKESGDSYQLIFTFHDVHTQILHGLFVANWNTKLKFGRPMTEFIEKFEEGHSAR